LQKTVGLARQALRFVSDAVAKGGSVLFVGTKKQAQDAIREEARCAGERVGVRGKAISRAAGPARTARGRPVKAGRGPQRRSRPR
jgi:hypothetical protein